jgi:hypothetical protein
LSSLERTFLDGLVRVLVVDEGEEILDGDRLALGHVVDVEEQIDREVASALVVVAIGVEANEPATRNKPP